MTARQVASLALKLTSVYLFLNLLLILLSQIPFIAFFLRSNAPTGLFDFRTPIAVISFCAMAGAFALLCVYLMVRSDRLAEMMVDDEHDLVLAPRVNGRDIQAIAFSILGATLLAGAIRQMPNTITSFMSANHSPSQQITEICSLMIQLLLGLALFFQGKGLARFWHNLRS